MIEIEDGTADRRTDHEQAGARPAQRDPEDRDHDRGRTPAGSADIAEHRDRPRDGSTH